MDERKRESGGRRWALAVLLGCVALLLVLAPTALAAGTGKISGTVISAASKADLEHIEVTVYEAEGKELLVGSAITEAKGEYAVTGLKSGSYTVVFYPVYGSGLNFVPQYYENTPFFKKAKPIKVVEGETKKGINATMQEGGEMSGTVTDAGTHKPLAGAGVVAYPNPLGNIAEAFRGHAVTNTNGEYTIFGLEPGEYIIEFESPGGSGGEYIGQFYNGQSSPTRASHVTAAQGEITPGIDAALVRKAPVNTVSPVVAGTPAVGQTLSCTGDSWTGAPKLSFTYQWLRNGVAIAGANGMAYGVQAADQGTGLSCAVTATNEYGHATATSNTLTVPLPPPSTTTTTITTSPPPKPEVELPSAKILVSGSSIRVPIACAKASCGGTIELTEQIYTEHHRGHTVIIRGETLLLGRGSYALSAGHSATIVVRLTSTGKHALARVKHHRLSANLSVSVAGGTAIQGPVVLSEVLHRHRR